VRQMQLARYIGVMGLLTPTSCLQSYRTSIRQCRHGIWIAETFHNSYHHSLYRVTFPPWETRGYPLKGCRIIVQLLLCTLHSATRLFFEKNLPKAECCCSNERTKVESSIKKRTLVNTIPFRLFWASPSGNIQSNTYVSDCIAFGVSYSFPPFPPDRDQKRRWNQSIAHPLRVTSHTRVSTCIVRPKPFPVNVGKNMSRHMVHLYFIVCAHLDRDPRLHI
jgi:hypothetical protein